jgi:ubiquinone/menaquinone biosynthesis C-methylase UbiE
MGYYDFKSQAQRTAIGQRIIEMTNDRVFSMIAPLLPEHASVLDIGAGPGEFARRCLAHGCTYSAVEANDGYAAMLKELGAHRVIKAFAPPIPLEADQFDLVYMSHLLEHMPDVFKALELVGEIRRVLKPGGLACIISPDFLNDPRLFFDGDYTHAFVTTENRMRMLLRDSDFELVVSRALAGPFSGFPGWLATMASKLYSRWLYIPLAGLLRPWVDRVKLGKPRSAFWRSIFVLARKPVGSKS